MPRYVHILAGLAFIAAASVMLVVYLGDRSTLGVGLLITVLSPAFVYVAFILFGGAYKRPRFPGDQNDKNV